MSQCKNREALKREALAGEGVRGEALSSEDLRNTESLYQYIIISMIQCIILSVHICH